MGCCGNGDKTDALEMEDHNGEGDDGKPAGKYGKSKKYDPNFAGPIKNRSCTDVICCLLFAVYVIGMLAVGFLAYTWGDPKKLLFPTDSHGNVCGTGSHADQKYLFFFDLLECLPTSVQSVTDVTSLSITGCKTPQVCVKECPTTNWYYKTSNDKSKLFCKDNTPMNQSISDLVDNGHCAKYTLQSEALAYRCVPTVIGETLQSFLDNTGPITTDGRNVTTETIGWARVAQAVLVNLQNLGEKLIADVRETWYWILGGFGISMVVSLLYIIMMRWVAGLMVWLTTYLVLTIIGYATYYCLMEYKRLADIDTSSIEFEFLSNVSSYADKKETWLALGIICGVVLLVLILLLLALRKRIVIAIQLIKEGSKCLSSMLSTLFFPLIPWLMQLILFAWFVAVMVYLVTSGVAEYKQIKNNTLTEGICSVIDAAADEFGKNVTCSFQQYKTDDNILRLQIFHLFGWFWIMNFIIAFGQCALAGAYASWYWAWDKKTDVPKLPLMYSMGRTLRYHCGSLAFGSLIIAIVQIIRAALEYLEYKLKGSGKEPSPVAKYLLKCLKCFFWCLEKFLKFLNKNAYIEIAVYGKNFCTSAKNAFFLLMRNILRVAVLDKVTDFLLFIGKLTVTGAMGVASFYFFSNRDDLNYNLAPVIIVTVATYAVASAFFGVYEMAINTIFLCFLEDCERHDGSKEKPFYMSKKLMKILGKKNDKAVEESKNNN